MSCSAAKLHRDAVNTIICSLVGANILEITHGIKALSHEDRFIKLAEAAQECFGKVATGGTYLVDVLPICEVSFDESTSSYRPHNTLHSETRSFMVPWGWLQAGGREMEAARRTGTPSSLRGLLATICEPLSSIFP